ncbi:MAG: hypothetical protein HY462_00905 [Parcubacteria group bacterium]|nr:hypothetical protein [Parcubacteria group bacterium]
MTPAFSIGEALRLGWRTTKEHFWFFVGLLLIIIVISMVPGVVFQVLEIREGVAVIVSQVIIMVFAILFKIGLLKIALAFVRGGRPSMAELYRSWHLFLKFLAGTLLYWLILLGGFILFIVPGIILALKFQWYTYFIVDKGLGPIAALKASSRATNGLKWDLLGVNVVFGIVNFLGVLALILGIFATAPTVIVAMAYVYTKLAANGPHTEAAA